MDIYGKHYGGLASGIWCERCRRAGYEAEMCATREPRRFNGLCDTCCWFGHLSCGCLLLRDRIYSDVPTLSSPPQSNRGGPGYDIPCYPPQQTPPSYSGRSGGPGYDIPCYPPQQTPPSYSGRSGGPGYDIPCYPPQQPVPRPSLALSGARGTTAATVQCRRNISTAVATTATVPTRVRSSSTDAAPMVAPGTVRHFRSSSQAPAPSLASAGSRGTLAAMDRSSRRRRQ